MGIYKVCRVSELSGIELAGEDCICASNASLDLSFNLTWLAYFFGTSNMFWKISTSKSQSDILIKVILIKTKNVVYIHAYKNNFCFNFFKENSGTFFKRAFY